MQPKHRVKAASYLRQLGLFVAAAEGPEINGLLAAVVREAVAVETERARRICCESTTELDAQWSRVAAAAGMSLVAVEPAPHAVSLLLHGLARWRVRGVCAGPRGVRKAKAVSEPRRQWNTQGKCSGSRRQRQWNTQGKGSGSTRQRQRQDNYLVMLRISRSDTAPWP